MDNQQPTIIMAKLSARGRVVVSAWTKTLPDADGIFNRRRFRRLMSDGNVLTRQSFYLPGSEYVPGRSVQKPWKICYTACKGMPMPEDIAKFERLMEEQGFQRE